MPTFHCSKWGSCNCPTGTVRADCPGLLDRRNVHVFEGEHLAAEKAWANRPFRAWPHHVLNLIIVVVLSGAIFLAFRAANAAMGAPV